MDEQYRMLGRERQADLDREARRFALADSVQRKRVERVRVRPWLFRQVASMLSGSGRDFQPAAPAPPTASRR